MFHERNFLRNDASFSTKFVDIEYMYLYIYEAKINSPPFQIFNSHF